MEQSLIRINNALLPLSWLYGLGVSLRNLLFDMRILSSRSYTTPVISVGNITVGGTGKTPHVEYLVRLLKDRVNVAVLSRGYKRKSRGFLLATAETPMHDIGDESYQIKQKFPDIEVAVDKKRTRGIERLTSGTLTERETDVVLLDDAFQHRYVKPGINILLVDYHRLIIYDKMLPAGRLREPLSGKNRADIVIITKCPKELTPIEYRVLTKQMDLYPYQQLFFTTLEYKEAVRLEQPADTLPLAQLADKHLLVVSGIASPKQLKEDLKREMNVAELTALAFGDHHYFGKRDVRRINEAFDKLPSPKLIVTTEKDATRLREAEGLSQEVRDSLYVLPIQVRFMLGQEEAFNDKIVGYVQKNSRNSILAKRKESRKDTRKDSRKAKESRTIKFK